MKRAAIFASACAALAGGCILDWDRTWDRGVGLDSAAPKDLLRREKGPPPDATADSGHDKDPHNWALVLGGKSATNLGNLGVDKAGYIYVGGGFTGTLSNKKATLTAKGEDTLLTRLTPQGEIDWTISGSSPKRDRVGGLFVAPGGDLYVTGHFNGTFTLGTKEVVSTNGDDSFMARLSPAGKAKWLTQISGTSSCAGHGVALNSSGSQLWVTGVFGHIATFGSTELTANGGSADIYVARLKPSSGEVIWATRAGGDQNDVPAELVLDKAGNAFIAGYFTNTADFGTNTLKAGAISTNKKNISNTVAARISVKDDKFAWATAGVSKSETRAHRVALDASGNIYIVGHFSGDTTFGSSTLTCQGQADILVVKLSSAGKVLWAKDSDGAGFELGTGIALDKAGNVLVTGFHDGPARMGGIDLPGLGKRDIFVTMLDPNGKVLWATSHGGSAGDDWGLSVALDGQGKAIVAGQCTGTVKLGKHTVTSKASAHDAFVWKFTPTTKGPM